MTQLQVKELLHKLENSLQYEMRFNEFDVQCKKLLMSRYITKSGDAMLRENRRKQGKTKNSDNYTRNVKAQMVTLRTSVREQDKLKTLLIKEKENLEAEIRFYQASMVDNARNHEWSLSYYQSNLYNQMIPPIGSFDFIR